MRRLLLLLVLAALLVAGCGEDEQPRPSPKAGGEPKNEVTGRGFTN